MDEARTVPLYVRIQDHIRTAISAGKIAPGDRIWSELELGNEFNTTRSTVRHALDQLVFEGLITRQAGRGSFVATQPHMRAPIDSRQCVSFEEQIALTGKTVTYRSPRLTVVPAPRHIAQQLGLADGTEIFELERIRVVEGLPVCLETRYITHDIGRQITGEMLARLPVHTFVSQILREPLPTILVSITAEIVGDEVAQQLELPEKVAVSVRTSAHYNSNKEIVLCGRCIFAGSVRTEYVLGMPLSD